MNKLESKKVTPVAMLGGKVKHSSPKSLKQGKASKSSQLEGLVKKDKMQKTLAINSKKGC